MQSDGAVTRVLVVAHRTAATEPLLKAVRERASRGRCMFTLLVPNPVHGFARALDPDDADEDEARGTIERALPRLSEAAGGPVEGIIGVADPSAAVQDALNIRGFDEIIISTLSPRISRWLKLDLPSKLSGLGVPITTITPADREEQVSTAA